MATSATSFPVPSVLGNLQNTEANLEALAGKSLNVEDIFVEEELEVKREEKEEDLEGKKEEKLEGKREEKEEELEWKREEEGKKEEGKESEIEEDLKDNKIFTDVKGFFNPQSRALQVSCLLIKKLLVRNSCFFLLGPHISAFLI